MSIEYSAVITRGYRLNAAEIGPSHYTDEDYLIKNLLSRYFPNKKDAEIHTYLGVKIS